MNTSSFCLLLTHSAWQSGRSGGHEGPLLERKHKEFGRNRGGGRWSWRGCFLHPGTTSVSEQYVCSTKRDNEVFYVTLNAGHGHVFSRASRASCCYPCVPSLSPRLEKADRSSMANVSRLQAENATEKSPLVKGPLTLWDLPQLDLLPYIPLLRRTAGRRR